MFHQYLHTKTPLLMVNWSCSDTRGVRGDHLWLSHGFTFLRGHPGWIWRRMHYCGYRSVNGRHWPTTKWNHWFKKKNCFTGEETGVSRKTTTRLYVWQSIRFYFKWWQAHSFLHWPTICFCVFHPPHLPGINMECIINHTYPSRAVSFSPDEA